MYTTEAHKEKVLEYLKNPTARNGVPWPRNPLEAFILAWIQLKSQHGYRWSEWSVATEAAEAAEAWFSDEIRA